MKLEKFDLLPKLNSEYRVSTFIGGILSIVSILFTILFSIAEIQEYKHQPPQRKFIVDTMRPASSDGVISEELQPHLNVEFDIFFPSAPCYFLHFDALDSVSQLPISINASKLKFNRYKNGKKIGVFDNNFFDKNTSECGKCHNSNESQCCNTCRDAVNDYLMNGKEPLAFESMEQCLEVDKVISEMKDEGCNIKASFSTVKIANSFHIAPGISWYSRGWHVHEMRPFLKYYTQQNLTHSIKYLRFTKGSDKTPLDNFSNVQASAGKWRATYSIDIIGETYMVSHFEAINSTKVTPGLYFQYDISPLTQVYYEARQPIPQLITNIIIVIGGVLFSFRFIGTNFNEKKRELTLEVEN